MSELMDDYVHLTDGGRLIYTGDVSYGLLSGTVYRCEICGKELEGANDYDFMGTCAEYDYFKAKGWEQEHGRPRRLYPDYPRI